MTWTQTTINILDGAGNSKPIIAYTDGTNFSFAHPLLDNTGAIISPATAGNQATMITALGLLSTSALQTAGNTLLSEIQSTVALDTSVNGLLVAQGSSTSGQKGPLVQGAVSTSAPSLTTGQTSPLSLDPSGNLRVVVSGGSSGGGTSSNFASAFPSAGTAIGAKNGSTMVNLTADGSGNLNVNLVTPIPAGSNTIGNVALAAGTAIAGKFGIDQTTPGTTNGVRVNAALPAGTNSIGNIGTVSTVTALTAITNALPSGTNLMGKVGIDQSTPGTTNGVQVNAALPAGSNVIGGVTIADGSAVTMGAKADSAVTTPGTTASLIALTKGLLTGINSLVTGTVLAAGTNLIGKFGIDQTTPGTTNAVSVGFVGGSAVTLNQKTKGNSIPVVQSGPQIISGGSFTRPANTTAYAQGQLVANSTTAGSVTVPTASLASANDVPVSIIGARLIVGNTSLTNGAFRIHLFSALPTIASGDGAAISVSMTNWCGSLDVTLVYAGSDSVAVGKAAPSPGMGTAINAAPSTGTQTVYWLIEARSAYTPTSGETFTVNFEAL
ncbi:beta strand repeat-containing protein [Fimbriiglobus ruber]|uniref:BNR repeat domain protein n=1 Tax=Fimbriiglobus ruber TaxID=1908690 RepID=A0A225DRE8_9BACT|nr:hypothetical protein [Fimbriiglobus ruber]OWK42214.1 BNR repeat domain protein [Fimbriiglobus ruber]